jgi:hypothetical protein
MPPNTRNRFANKLAQDQERKRRLYLLDSDPLHSLQIFGVPQYLPRQIHGYNAISSADFVRHHDRVKELVQSGHLDLTKFDEDGLESSLAFVFGIDVPSKTLQEPPKKIRCLQIYYAAPAVEDVPPGVFGSTGTREQSVWTELPRPLKKGSGSSWQHHSPVAGASSRAAEPTSAGGDDEDGPTRVPSPEPAAGSR